MPEGVGPQGEGYHFIRGAPGHFRMVLGRTTHDWRRMYADDMPPQAMLSGLYMGSYMKRSQRKDFSQPGYYDKSISCRFTLTILGPALGAAYFRFQVQSLNPLLPGIALPHSDACTWLSPFKHTYIYKHTSA